MELSVLARQCLDQRIPDHEALASQVVAWQQRNDDGVKVNRQFTTEDARIKWMKLYPSIQMQ